MSTPEDSETAPKVTVKLTAQYTRETLLLEAWAAAAEEAKRRGLEPPPLPPVTDEADQQEIIGERVTWFTTS